MFTALFSGTLDTLEAAPVVVVHSGSVGALKLRLNLKHRSGASDAKQQPGSVGALKLRLNLKHRSGASDAKQQPGFIAVTVVTH